VVLGTAAESVIMAGNVSIGKTTTPGFALDVVGKAQFTSDVSINGSLIVPSTYISVGRAEDGSMPTTGVLRVGGGRTTGTYLKIQKLGEPTTWGIPANYDATRYINCTSNADTAKDFNVGPGGVGIGYAPPLYARGGVDGLYVNGNVGIGTTTPGAALEVAGGINIQGANVINFGSNTAGKEGNAGKIGYNPFSNGCLDITGAGTASGSRKVFIYDQLGIGMAPNFPLDVAGKAQFSSDVSINGSLVVNGNLSVQKINNQYIINQTTTNYQLIVSEDISLNGRLYVSGNVYAGQPLVRSSTIGQSDTYNQNAFHSFVGNTVNGQINPIMAIYNNYATSSTALNDPTPMLQLHRSGTFNGSYDAAANFNLSRYVNNATNSRTRLDIALANGATATPDTTVMTLLSNGNVGIGTTTPGYKLDIRASNLSASSGTNISQNIIIAGDYGSGGSYGGTAGGYLQGGTNYQQNTYLALGICNGTQAATITERIRIVDNGYIGIGTTAPAYTLDVYGGNIRASAIGGNNDFKPDLFYNFPFQTGMFQGTGDGASNNTFNLAISSWNSIGFMDTCFKVNRINMDVRNGSVNSVSYNLNGFTSATYTPIVSNTLSSNTWTNTGITWTSNQSSYFNNNPQYAAYSALTSASAAASANNIKWASFAGTYSGGGLPISGVTTPVTLSTSGSPTIVSVSGEWIQVQANTPVVLNNYALYSSDAGGVGGNMPKTWWILGSNNGTTWNPIQYCSVSAQYINAQYTSSNNIGTSSGNGNYAFGPETSTITTTVYGYPYNSFTYFRMVVSSTFGTGLVDIGRWVLNFNKPSTTGLYMDSAIVNQMNITGGLATAGNVGIGTTNPVSTLDISGTVSLSTGSAANTYKNLYGDAPPTNVYLSSFSPNTTNATSNSWFNNGVTWTANVNAFSGNNSGYFAFNNQTIDTGGGAGWMTTDYSAAGAYTGSTITPVYKNSTLTSVIGNWLQIQSNVPVTLNSYTMTTAGYSGFTLLGRAPGQFTIAGSNDGNAWYDLQDVSFTSLTSSGWTGSTTMQTCNSFAVSTATGNLSYANVTTYTTKSTPYTYFRFILLKTLQGSFSISQNSGSFSQFLWTPNFSVASQTGPSRTLLYMDPSNINQLDVSGSLGLINSNASTMTVTPNTANATQYVWQNNNITWAASGSSTTAAPTAPFNGFSAAGAGNLVGYQGGATTYTNSIYSGSIGNTYNVNQNGSIIGISGEWLQIQTSVPLVMKNYSIGTIGYSVISLLDRIPGVYTIVGSNDGNNWFDLLDASFTAAPTSTAISTTSLSTALYSVSTIAPATGTFASTQQSNNSSITYSAASNAYTYFRLIAKRMLSALVLPGVTQENSSNIYFIWTPYFSPAASSVSLALDNGLPNQLNVGGAMSVAGATNISGELTINNNNRITGNLYMPGYPSIFCANNETLPINSIAIPTYGLSWQVDAAFNSSAPTGFFSSYGGLKFQTVASTRMTITNAGNIGIGRTDPAYTVDVTGNMRVSAGIRITGSLSESLSTTGNPTYYNNGSGWTSVGNVYGGANLFGLAVDSRALMAEIWIKSDLRIKKNIKELSSELSLSILRSIQPKTYEYIDSISNGSDKKYGFVAQEIKDVFPDSLDNFYTKYIPNIYEIATLKDKTIVILKEKTTDIFEADSNGMDASGNRIKIQVYDDNNKLVETTIKNIIDDKTFIINDPIDSNYLFVYGREVSDFHSINYQNITIISISAIKAIDKVVETQKNQIQDLEVENADLKSRITQIETRLTAAGIA
jgi:hypothetical protein